MVQRTLDPFAVLGLAPDADEEQVAQAHRRLAKRYHPDLNPGPGATERMRRINEARQILAGKRQRMRYAGSGPTGGPSASARQAARAEWPPRSSGTSGWWTDESYSDRQRWAAWQPRGERIRQASAGAGGEIAQDTFGAAGCAVLVLAIALLYFLLRLPLY